MTILMSLSVTVPATTANLGPGFDCIGAALTLYNEFKFTPLDGGETIINVVGQEAQRVNTDKSNLLYQAFTNLYLYIEQVPPPVQMDIELGVPLARGLGSSATAIVAGLLGANALAGEPLTQTQVMKLAIAMEGHPDNVVPALLGGCRLAATGTEPRRGEVSEEEEKNKKEEEKNKKEENKQEVNWEVCEVGWSQDVIPVVAIPDFELSTVEARKVLPKEVSRGDAIFNAAHLGLLLRGLETGNGDWLKASMQDKLHQPYRKTLIKGYDAVQEAALNNGAYGMVISGAGPTLLALTNTANSQNVADSMVSAWNKEGVSATVRVVSIDNQGSRVKS